MSQLPPDLMRQDRDPEIGSDNDALDQQTAARPIGTSDHSSRHSRLPLLFSGIALFTSLSAGALAYAVYEQGVRSVRSEIAAIDRRLTEVELRMSQFNGDIDLKMENLSALVQELNRDLVALSSDMQQYREHAAEQNARLSGVEGVVTDLETFIKSLSARVVPRSSTPKAAARAAPRKTADVKLLSVRSIGDIAVVRIGNQAGQSPLLQVGDRWGQWEFSGLDGNGVQLKHNGQEYRLAL